jgi:hypothetical protein
MQRAASLLHFEPGFAVPRWTGFMIGLLSFGFLATALYWFIWFGVDRNLLATHQSEAYFDFELAFPLADAWMAVTSLLGALALIRNRPSALLWSLLAGSASIFLALMGILYDLQHGTFSEASVNPAGSAIEAAINVATLLGGIASISFGWSNRHFFLGLDERGLR